MGTGVTGVIREQRAQYRLLDRADPHDPGALPAVLGGAVVGVFAQLVLLGIHPTG